MPADPNSPDQPPSPGDGTGAPGAGTSGEYDPSHRNGTSGEALHEAMRQFGELRDFFRYYLATWIDGFKSSIRRTIVYAALGVLALFIGCAIVVTAAVLLLNGLAGAVSRLFDAGPWVGQLIVGIAVIGGLVLVAWAGMSQLDRLWRKKAQARYDAMKRQQRIRWGEDVEDAAKQSGRREA